MPDHPGQPAYKVADYKDALIEALSLGASYEIACHAAGINYNTFRKWMQKGEDAESQEYIDFFRDIKRAIAADALECLQKIRDAYESDPKHWTASAWKLERRHPKSYGRDSAYLELKEDIEKLKSMKEEKSNG